MCCYFSAPKCFAVREIECPQSDCQIHTKSAHKHGIPSTNIEACPKMLRIDERANYEQ